MFSFDVDKLLNCNNTDKLWDAYEEVCCYIAKLKTLKKNVPVEISKLKSEIKGKLNK